MWQRHLRVYVVAITTVNDEEHTRLVSRCMHDVVIA